MDLELIRNDTSLAENTYNNDVYVRDDEWLKYVWLCLLKVRTWAHPYSTVCVVDIDRVFWHDVITS